MYKQGTSVQENNKLYKVHVIHFGEYLEKVRQKWESRVRKE